MEIFRGKIYSKQANSVRVSCQKSETYTTFQDYKISKKITSSQGVGGLTSGWVPPE